MVEISEIEPLLFVCLEDSQKSWIKQKTNLSVGLVDCRETLKIRMSSRTSPQTGVAISQKVRIMWDF